MAKALDGITVIEFCSNLAAAYAAMLLAEHGAETIRIEPPGGDPARLTPHFHVLNRGKRSVAAALESADGRAAAEALMRRADIVVHGFTRDRARRLGVDAQRIAALNPRAIALELPPFGNRGPDADFEAGEALVAAFGGISGSQWARSGNPVPLVFPAASYSAGVMGA